MINIRYHIVSITAIFLALGIGTLLGSTFLDRATVDQLDRNIRNAEARIADTEQENGRLEEELRLGRGPRRGPHRGQRDAARRPAHRPARAAGRRARRRDQATVDTAAARSWANADADLRGSLLAARGADASPAASTPIWPRPWTSTRTTPRPPAPRSSTSWSTPWWRRGRRPTSTRRPRPRATPPSRPPPRRLRGRGHHDAAGRDDDDHGAHHDHVHDHDDRPRRRPGRRPRRRSDDPATTRCRGPPMPSTASSPTSSPP